MDGRSIEKVFGNDGFRAEVVGFSKDSNTLYLRSNHENKKVYSIYELEIGSTAPRRLTDGKESWDGFEISDDQRFMVLQRNVGNNETHIFRLDPRTKKTQRLFAEKGTNFDIYFFHPEKPVLYVDSNLNRDRMGCATIDLSARSPKLRWEHVDDKKDLSCNYSKSSNTSTITEQFDGQINIRLFDGVFGKELETPIPSKVVATNFSALRADDYAFVKLTSADNPGDFYRFKLSDGKKAKLEPISKLNLSSIPQSEFGKSYDIRYKSFDGREIHGVIFAKESWVAGAEKRPMILWPHGGPDHHEMHIFSPLFQYWVLNGYVVFAPNFRGSTGYGKKFETLNDRDWGGAHIKDLVWGRRAMAQKPYIDPERTYIVGASFGGFSTLSTITQFPTEFRAAVGMVALANLFTFYKSIPPDPAWQMEFLTEMGHPEKDAALYKERSPYFHANQIKIPLKIYQAENDVRTVKPEMDNFVARLRELNIPVEYEILEKEGHQPTRAENWQKVMQGTVEFLNAH